MYLELKNVNKIINKNNILDNVNIQMEKGNIYGFMGINGSGKTMLMRCICGLIRPTSGEVIINGKKLGVDCDFPESIGALIENPGFIEHYTAIDNMMELASIKKIADKDKICSILNEVGLEPLNLKKVKKYSLGMRQKLGIAIAFMEEPDILVLDEPFNALDTVGCDKIKTMISKRKEQGKLIILSCHDKNTLEILSDKIFEIENGRIINEYVVKKVSKVEEIKK
jgi:ABC-2 type transport system ATP-binding protein